MSAQRGAISVIVPAHNEAQYLGACIDSLRVAAAHPSLAYYHVDIVVVLDHCDDGSFDIAQARGATCLKLNARNVGAARDAGARLALAKGAQWLAFTDADSLVADDWLAAQQHVIVDQACDAVCGVVAVDDWVDYPVEVRAAYEAQYMNTDGHRHIHGANLGVSAQAYLLAGGFLPLACHEDVTLVRKMEAMGMCIAWSARPSVRTSSRRAARVEGGFSDFLKSLEATLPAGLCRPPVSGLTPTVSVSSNTGRYVGTVDLAADVASGLGAGIGSFTTPRGA